MPENSPAETVLALANGDPLVVEAPIHRGRVVLVATSAEPAWTRAAALAKLRPVGSRDRGLVCPRAASAAEPHGGRAVGRFDRHAERHLRGRFGPPPGREETFAVNVDTAESDLAQIDPEELQDEVWPGVPFVHQTSWQDLGATGPGSPIRGGNRLHVGLLYAVLGLLFVETFLGWKMGYHARSRDSGWQGLESDAG